MGSGGRDTPSEEITRPGRAMAGGSARVSQSPAATKATGSGYGATAVDVPEPQSWAPHALGGLAAVTRPRRTTA